MFWYRRDPGTDGVGVAITSAGSDLSDPPSARSRAFGELSEELGVQIAVVRQVHGATVLDMDALEVGSGPLLDLTDHAADALVTRRRRVALAIRVADCIPVLFADPGAGVIGAAHAGRAGLLAGVVGATVEAMTGRGAERIVAWVGPHLCGSCYELPEDIVSDASARLGVAPSRTDWGTLALDMTAAVVGQLESLGVEADVLSGCTRSDPTLHSWRRDHEDAGRQAGLVWLT